MQVLFANQTKHALPEYETISSAGIDLRAKLDEPIILPPISRTIVPTGMFTELPVGYETQVRPRSGLAIKHGISVINSPGTIDADCRGEIKVILLNLSDSEFIIQDGERIAQIVISAHVQAQLKEKEVLTESKSSAEGFGHTGQK
jgi:dUTP pyrophosphatase